MDKLIINGQVYWDQEVSTLRHANVKLSFALIDINYN